MKIVKKIKPFFTDQRGEMSYIFDNKNIVSALLISSKKNSIRANHYHKKDTHYVYLLKGKLEYTYQKIKAKSKKKVIVDQGSLIYTPPMTIHAMKFIKDSIFLAFSTKKRQQKKYENDTVRIQLV